jgi:hypothetical protein
MSLGRRYHPAGTFPSYAYLPKRNIHPTEAGGYREGQVDPVVSPIVIGSANKNESFCFAIDLFNHEYFWESHVYLEALWNAHARKGTIADFMRILIRLAASIIKIKTGADATTHMDRAQQMLRELVQQEGRVFLDIDLQELIDSVNTLRSSGDIFQIHPRWTDQS